jgi:hypothetical protein
MAIGVWIAEAGCSRIVQVQMKDYEWVQIIRTSQTGVVLEILRHKKAI